jgi:hypothetical protein
MTIHSERTFTEPLPLKVLNNPKHIFLYDNPFRENLPPRFSLIINKYSFMTTLSKRTFIKVLTNHKQIFLYDNPFEENLPQGSH